jgi:hypothetical protein
VSFSIGNRPKNIANSLHFVYFCPERISELKLSVLNEFHTILSPKIFALRKYRSNLRGSESFPHSFPSCQEVELILELCFECFHNFIQLHRAFNCRLGPAMGSTEPARHEDQAQPGAADPSQEPVWSFRRRPEGVLDDVPALRQGQDRKVEPQRIQVLSTSARIRSADARGRGAGAGV